MHLSLKKHLSFDYHVLNHESRAQMTWNNFVTIKKASDITGLTEKAIRRKIEEQIWVEGKQFFRAPDARIFISLAGFEAWLLKK